MDRIREKLQRVRRNVKNILAEPAPVVTEKFGSHITPNMRALRLTLTIADQLLSMNVSANDVVVIAERITRAYCGREVQVEVTYTSIMLSQDRGIDREPLTLARNVKLRDINYTTVQDIETLVAAIKKGLPLVEAEMRIKKIIAKPAPYPMWSVIVSNAIISAAVVFLFSTSLVVIITTFIVCIVVGSLLRSLWDNGWPLFFAQTAAASVITMSAVGATWLGSIGITPFHGANPTLIVVGGIVMLVAGLTAVGAAEDAIDEFYITAGARFFQVLMLTAGIVVGIFFGLTIARLLGVAIDVSPDPIPLGSFSQQLIGALIIAAAYAFSTQSNVATIINAGVIGVLGWCVYSVLAGAGLSEPAANGGTALFVGFVSVFVARYWRSPSVALVSCGIVPFVPGLSLYNGLMQLINYPPGDPNFDRGIGTLFVAISVALAIATGASIGTIVGRPLRDHLVRVKRNLPL